MSIQVLPSELLQLVIDHSEDYSLSNISRVNKELNYYATKAIWARLTILLDSPTMFYSFIRLTMNKKELAKSIRNLNLVGVKLLPASLHSLLDLTVGLTFLCLNKVGIEINLSRPLPILPLLRNFRHTPASEDIQLNVLRAILISAKNLNTLQLEFNNFPFSKLLDPINPISVCPETLKLLSINSYASSFAAILSNSSAPFLPLNSLRNLQEIRYYGAYWDNLKLEAILNVSRHSLKTLSLGPSALGNTLDFSILLSSFPKLASLESLYISGVPLDFLQHIPQSVHTLFSNLSFEHLQHLALHPRPKLQLKSIELESPINNQVWSVLPQSVTIINIYHFTELELDDVFESLKNLHNGNLNLMLIRIDELLLQLLTEEESDQDDVAKADETVEFFRDRFLDLNIVLQIKNTDIEI